ncbi:MAG: hypothetical protein ACRC62_15780 [Microcoleus sp.]
MADEVAGKCHELDLWFYHQENRSIECLAVLDGEEVQGVVAELAKAIAIVKNFFDSTEKLLSNSRERKC